MFCEKCGAKIEESAQFCMNCGAKVSGAQTVKKEKVEDTEIQLEVKPAFKLVYLFLPSFIVYAIIILIFGLSMSAISPSAGFTIVLIGLLGIIVILGIKALINKKQYDNYNYDFYKTKVVYRDSFINLSEKEVKYKYIREITMRQTFIQRFFNIGNIILFTNAETGFGNGIFIINVENVEDVYKKIKEIIQV